jgi:hypothetical protein
LFFENINNQKFAYYSELIHGCQSDLMKDYVGVTFLDLDTVLRYYIITSVEDLCVLFNYKIISKDEVLSHLKKVLTFKYDNFFKNNNVSIFYRPKPNKNTELRIEPLFVHVDMTDYNFVEVTGMLDEAIKEINLYCDNIDVKCDNYDKIIPCVKINEVENKVLNEKVYNVLKPMISKINATESYLAKLMFDIKFTSEDGKLQPWLIKDFIKSLQSVGIDSVHNMEDVPTCYVFEKGGI